MDYYTPGQMAERFDLTLDTLRYYEKAGLLRQVDRAPSGHRRYRADDAELLHLIRCLRDTDMPIARLREFAELVRAGDHTIPERVDVLQSHQRRLDEHIAELRVRQKAIQHKIEYYLGVLADGDADSAAPDPDPTPVPASTAAPAPSPDDHTSRPVEEAL